MSAKVWKIIQMNDTNITTYFNLSEQTYKTKRLNDSRTRCPLSFDLDSLPPELKTNLFKSGNYTGSNQEIKNLPIIQDELDYQGDWGQVPNLTLMQSFYSQLPNSVQGFFAYIGSFFNG